MEFIYSNRWCDLMFENRNKKYGAYYLRRKNADYLILSLFIALAMLLSGIGLFYQLGGPSEELIKHYSDKSKKADDVIYTIEKFLPPAMPASPQKPVAPAPTPVQVKGQGLPVVVDRTETSVPTIPSIIPNTNAVSTDIPAITGNNTSTTSGGGENSGTASTAPMLNPEVMPEFPGGEEALVRFLQKNIRYPQQLLMSGVQGTVYLGFVIDKAGNITDIKVLKGVTDAFQFSEEAVRVLKKSPVWKPGMQGGHLVSVSYSLPVTFIAK